MTGTLMQPAAIKDILTGIFLCMLIIVTMYIIPVIGIFAWIFLPLPVLFYRLKTGRNGGGIIMGVSLAVLILFTRNFAFNILYFGSLLMTGFFLGEFIEKHLSIEKIMLYTCFAICGTCMTVLLIYSSTQAQGIEHLISNYISRYHALTSQLFSESAQLYPEMNIDRQMLEKASSIFVIAFPGIFFNSYLTMVWLNILFIKKLLLKKGIIV
ncbi:MAG: YybS family protein, partial [Proteobacteria bacterium]|nr:YybS family protein [Pseudomonadota bacterium]MBU1582534.1 YybS family protein [Pseudomonadota bacterium]